MKKVYEDNCISVWENGSGEIIVENKFSNDKNNYVRLTPYSSGSIEITAPNSIFRPMSFNGLDGFLVQLK